MSKKKKAIVVGLARSGAGAAGLLLRMGYEVTVTDKKTGDSLTGFVEKLSPGVGLSLGGHQTDKFESADLIVVSPGVPLDIEPLMRARAKGVRIIGELELAYKGVTEPRLAGVIDPSLSVGARQVPFYAVTGTNGKSTTSTLVDLMMRKAGRRSVLAGNIGNALTEEVMDPFPYDCVVVEVSSFQLESTEEFRPAGAAILNVTPDHLDRYRSMDEYREAKARVYLNQTGDDFLVLNADDPEILGLGGMKSKVYFFSRSNEADIYSKGGVLYWQGKPLIEAERIRVKGVHNLENAMAASAVALLSGCRPEAVVESLIGFPGLEHRLEFVRELNGVRYVNDSKGTNVGAVIKSIESFNEPVLLIAGGRDKAGKFEELRPFVKGRVKAVLLIGEAAGKIKSALSDLAECVPADTLRDAVEAASGMARAGDVVLLSPACASFDMFRDFEDRGRQFKDIVMKL